MLVLFIFGFLISALIFLFVIFVLSPFIKKFVCFQFISSITICHLLYSFFLNPLVKVLLVFNFIIQSNFMAFYFFQFGTHSFDFLFFVKFIFLFSLTIQSTNLCCPLIFFILIFTLIFLITIFCFRSFCVIDFFSWFHL
jgi:hypothetical protein